MNLAGPKDPQAVGTPMRSPLSRGCRAVMVKGMAMRTVDAIRHSSGWS
jgi:hypothetical protein